MVVFGEEVVNDRLQIGYGSEDVVLELLTDELRKEIFHGAEPEAGGGREVENPARTMLQPNEHIGMLVGFVIVEHDADDFTGEQLGLNGFEEADELPVTNRVVPRWPL